MISITNTQRAHNIDVQRMTAQVQRMLDHLDYHSFDVGILICVTTRMRTYNRDFRHKDKVTDVLSFPFHENRDPNVRITVTDEHEKNLGDLILCPQYIAATCHKWERSFDKHLTALLAHGIAHLLGHDHITDEDFAQMHPVEQQLILAAKG